LGRPVLPSSFTSSRLSLNLLCHSKRHSTFFIASAPLASVNICRASLVLLPNFAQNLILMRCSNNLSLIFFFAGTKTHARVTLPLLRYYCLICFTNTQPQTRRNASLLSSFSVATRCDIYAGIPGT
jgi:hypothetical protein